MPPTEAVVYLLAAYPHDKILRFIVNPILLSYPIPAMLIYAFTVVEMCGTCIVTDYSNACKLQVNIVSPFLLLLPMFALGYVTYLVHKLCQSQEG